MGGQKATASSNSRPLSALVVQLRLFTKHSWMVELSWCATTEMPELAAGIEGGEVALKLYDLLLLLLKV